MGNIGKLLKSIKAIDWLILVVGIYLCFTMDYQNLSLIDEVYLVSVVIWLALLVGRLVVEYRKMKQE